MPAFFNEQHWHQVSAAIISGMRDWRTQHPAALLREIEDDGDRRRAVMHARMVEDMARQRAAADWHDTPYGAHPT